MDRQDAKPSRPSLLAGAQPNATPSGAARPSPARILADMEGPAGSRGKPVRGGGWWVPGIAVVALLAVVGGWMLTAGDENDAVRAARVSLHAEPSMTLHADAPPAAATIIEESPASGDAESLQTVAAAPGQATPANPAGAAAPNAAASPGSSGNPFAAAPVTRRRPTPATAPRTASKRTAAGEEPDLLAVLLGNIRAGEGKAAERDVDGLDALIRSMQASEGASPDVARAEPTRTGQPVRTRSEQIQSNLRECPPPNTPKGLLCRQEICAVYAGRDPACPAG